MFTVSLRHRPSARRASARWAPALAVFATVVGLQVQAQQALSFDQALQLAQGRSQQLVAQDAVAAAAREMAIAAGQMPDPTLKVGLTDLPVSGSERFSATMTARTVAVMQEFTRSDKLKARSARFDREAETAEAARTLALANLRRDTASAWLDRYYQERMLEALRSQRGEATLQIEAADAAYRGGRGAQADVFAARSMVALIDDRIRQAEQQIATAKTRLARWVGDEASQPLGGPPALAAVGLDSSKLESRLARHPEIAMMVRQEAMARADAGIAQSNKRADWGVELMFSQRGQGFSNMVSVNVSIPLQLDQKHRQDREVSAKLALVEQMRAQREEATRERLAEARSWLQEWHSGRDRLSHYDSALLPLAGERTRAALAAYRGGASPLGAVLEARRIEIDTRLDRLRLEMETASLWARLETLIPPESETAPQPGLTGATEK